MLQYSNMFHFLKYKLNDFNHYARIYKKGFTLIELLVVIAIIGILASVVLASLNSVRVNARDIKRIQDVKQLKTILELYYTDNGNCPSVGTDNAGYSVSTLSVPLASYISNIALDPGYDRAYVRGISSNNSYGIHVYQEKTGTYCVSGVNISSGWWSPISPCSF